ncbi:MAG: energy transducer TonB, partial [Burkholderiales bacterium]
AQGQVATSPADAAPPASAHYYRSAELDVRPGIKTRVEPAYPEAAARRGLSGTVVLRLYINENGAVDRVETLRARPAGVFERSAEQAFREARFTPGMKDKHPVKVQMTIEVSFDTPPPVPPAGWR